MTKAAKKWDWEKILFWLLFASLLGSTLYVVVRMIFGGPFTQNELGDYSLKLLQCLLGLAVVFLPALVEKKLRISLPDYMVILYFIFLYCAIYLGEMRSFYYRVPHWDTILHTFSGGMLGVLGFVVVDVLNRSAKTSVALSPVFLGLFAFCFAVAFGVVWEFWEFAWDGLLGLNMQKFALEGGKELVGRAALMDTMKDLIVDALGALVVSVIGGVSRHKKQTAAQ